MLPRRVIGLQLFNFALSPDLGMSVIDPLLMEVEVAPVLSIAENARRRVGVISNSNSWKNSNRDAIMAWGLPFGERSDGS
ncbi:unnamed protein product [Sphagnum tenellum]